MKILLAVDGSDYTKRMLAYLAAHEELLGRRHEYTVIHSVHALPRTASPYVGTAAVNQFYEEEAEAVLDPVRTFLHQQGIRAEFETTVGQAARSIASVAKEGKFGPGRDGIAW